VKINIALEVGPGDIDPTSPTGITGDAAKRLTDAVTAAGFTLVRQPVAHLAERVRELAAAGHHDPDIADLLDLRHSQVYGIRRRADPPIPAAIGRGRPRGSLDREPRKALHGMRRRKWPARG
jgi:hypothetical protein